MVVLKSDTLDIFCKNPENLSKWMHTINNMRAVLISLFASRNIHGWQGLRNELLNFDFDFETKDLIVFYSGYELKEEVVDMLVQLSLKLCNHE